MKIGLYIFLAVFISFTSCKEQIKTDTDELLDVIDADTYAHILADAQLIEAQASIVRVNQPYFKDSVPNYYAALFEKYNVTSKDFYYSMKAYAYRPDELNAIYEQSIIYLRELETELADELIISKPIVNISRQQVGDIIMSTPFMNSIMDDSTGQLEIIQDSLFQFILDNDSLIKSFSTNAESFQYSFILNSHQPAMYLNLKSYLRGKLEKKNGID
jgi:hypothetical protein